MVSYPVLPVPWSLTALSSKGGAQEPQIGLFTEPGIYANEALLYVTSTQHLLISGCYSTELY